MALDFENSVGSMQELAFWYKLKNNEELTLSDMPEIIRLRWPYFRDNWETIKPDYESKIEVYPEADKLRLEIESFSEFITTQRTSAGKRNPFDNEDILVRFYTIFDNTIIGNISLTYEEQQQLDNKINRIDGWGRGEFLYIRSLLQAERDAIADRASASDEDYNRVFDRSSQAARVNIKNADINKMFELMEAIKAIDFILANIFSLDTAVVDPFALARANAANEEIEIGDYNSGTLAKLNYGEDLQALAARTLGDPDRWIDIAIANGLKPPYIDEVGQKLLLISNASGNQINISGTDDNGELNIDKLSVGQFVQLQSDAETFPEQRGILNITEVPVSGELIIQLDGEPDLDRYKLVDNAYISIFKQNTINSGFYILIPSTEELDDDLKSDTPWFLRASDVTEKRQKIDLFLDENGDITFDPTGDLQLSYGLDNAIQAIKLKLVIEQGELRRHPEYGLIAVQGSANNNIEAVKNILIESITSNIAADERFSRINRLDIGYSNVLNANSGVSLNVVLEVVLAGSGQLVPITFDVNA